MYTFIYINVSLITQTHKKKCLCRSVQSFLAWWVRSYKVTYYAWCLTFHLSFVLYYSGVYRCWKMLRYTRSLAAPIDLKKLTSTNYYLKNLLQPMLIKLAAGLIFQSSLQITNFLKYVQSQPPLLLREQLFQIVLL